MKAFEFLTEQYKNGTLIAVRPTPISIKNIALWLENNQIKNAVPLTDLHVTIVYSKNSMIPWKIKTYKPPIKIDPKTYKIELFGNNHDILVLSFSCDYLQKIHQKTREKYQLPWDFDNYIPHITLSYSSNNVDKINIPDFPIYLNNEYIDDYKKDLPKEEKLLNYKTIKF